MKTGTAILATTICIVVVAALSATAQAPTPIPSVWLQPASPGTAQNGNINITGRFVETVSQASSVAMSVTNTGASGIGLGVYAPSSNSDGINVFGSRGIYALGLSGEGIYSSGATYGVFGNCNSGTAGVYGQSDGGMGVKGNSQTNIGVRGESNNAAGVVGVTNSTSSEAAGVYGFSPLSSPASGVRGYASNALAPGVYGTNTSNAGVYGYGNVGVRGDGIGSDGVRGTTSANAAGVSGSNNANGIGVYASSAGGTALEAYGGGYAGIYGTGPVNGIHGLTSNNSASAVYALNTGNGWGVYGASGTSGGSGTGVAGYNANAGGYAVYSNGNFASSGGKSFQIDHPFDPANKYLNHFCTEGAEPLNVYSGTVTTDGDGYATIALPDYFAEINKSPRIQLTVFDDSDDFVMAKVSKKVEGCQFTIRTSKPGVEVFWRVEATRNDNWMRIHGFKVEQEKPEQYRGKYLNPEFFGKPETSGQFYMPRMEGTAQKPKR